MRLRQLALLFFLVLPGLAGAAVFGCAALRDWTALQVAYAQFEQADQQHAGGPVLAVAEAKQNLHRLNLLAEGVWTLLAAILAAIGLHGLCVMPKESR